MRFHRTLGALCWVVLCGTVEAIDYREVEPMQMVTGGFVQMPPYVATGLNGQIAVTVQPGMGVNHLDLSCSQSNPPGVDGQIAAANYPATAVSNAPVQYAGVAPLSVAGFGQVNLTVPMDAPSGAAVR